jgi:hypothetical protein
MSIAVNSELVIIFNIQVLIRIKPKKSSRGNIPYHRESGLVGMTCLKITIHLFSLNFEQIKKKKKGPNADMVRTTETFKVDLKAEN